MNGAIYVSNSGNSKLNGHSKIDATYASIKSSCPLTCSLKDNGCYAQNSYTGITVKRLDKEANGYSVLQIAKAEAFAIDNSYNGGQVPAGRDLRLHVSGDCRTISGARIVNAAVKRWKNRGGGNVFNYTHSWKNVPRKEWKDVSILASVSDIKEVDFARKQGYAPAIVVSEFDGPKAFFIKNCDTRWVPCPAQTKPEQVSCSSCKLCMKSDYLFKNNIGIAFAAHGVKKNDIKRRLKVIS